MSQKMHDTVNMKLADLDTPGAVVEMDPEEAELAGAFVEDALTAEDALEAAADERERGSHEPNR